MSLSPTKSTERGRRKRKLQDMAEEYEFKEKKAAVKASKQPTKPQSSGKAKEGAAVAASKPSPSTLREDAISTDNTDSSASLDEDDIDQMLDELELYPGWEFGWLSDFLTS